MLVKILNESGAEQFISKAEFLGYYSVWGSMSQSGFSDPDVIVQPNDLGITQANFTRNGEGSYSITKTGAFPVGTVPFIANVPKDEFTALAYMIRANDSTISICTTEINGNPADDMLRQCSFEIRVPFVKE